MKLKKKIILFVFFFFVLVFFFLFHSRNYEIEYNRDSVQVEERFMKKEKVYEFIFHYNEKDFIQRIPNSYISSKKLVKSIEIKEVEEAICLIPSSKKLNMTPVCLKDNEQLSPHLVLKEEETEIHPQDTYENITIYNLNQKSYLLWNYKGFYKIDSKKKENISLFENDTYSLSLVEQVGNYLILADYDQKYEFQKFYVLNSKNGKIKELSLKEALPFDSYFLGVFKNKAYLIDKKNKQEYKINPKKLEIEKISKKNIGKLYTNNAWESLSMDILASNEKKFTYDKWISYQVENNTLYAIINTYKVKLSNQKVKEIVYFEEDTVYYLVEDKLYCYNPEDGEIVLLSNFEWNFNYKNMVFIF